MDTSVIIDFLNGEKKITELINSYALREIISVTTITEYELLKHKDKIKREIAEGVINSMQLYNFDRKSAAEAARIFERLNSIGKMINQNDIFIAGIALANNELLITRDEKFNYINNERIIVV